MAAMTKLADRAEGVIAAKVAEDFAHAVGVAGLAAATACFGRTTVTRLAALPGHSGYNRARGFNLDDVDQLPAICSFFTDAGLPPLIEVWAGDASPALGQQLAHAGFFAAEVNVTLWAEPGSGASAADPEHREIGPHAIELHELTAEEDDAGYLDTLFRGYGLSTEPLSAEQTMMAIEHRSPQLRRYLAYVGGRPAAAAALYIGPEGTYFAGAATIPAMRGRGCQSALIRRRLRDAGTVTQPVFVTTAFDSSSQSNLQRHGFQIVHTRALWRRIPTGT
jgi:hypothetical protein